MPVPVGQPETINVTWRDKSGNPFDPTATRVQYQGPGQAPVVVTTPDARIGRGGQAPGSGYYELTIPTSTQSGVWLFRWEALDGSGNLLGPTFDGSVVFTSSAFVQQQPGSFPYPYGYILQSAQDFAAIRDSLGFQAVEIPDTLIGDADFGPAAEAWIWRQVPDWQIIMSLAAPAAPALAAVANPSSALLAATYYVRLVARVGATPSDAGAEASQAITAGQALTITAPQAPGITAYDAYVGVAAGMEFLQFAGIAPGATLSLLSFTMRGQPAQAVGLGDVTALKAATMAITCAFLCRRFQRFAPARLRTMTYEEEFKVVWDEEAQRYLDAANLYLGMISTWKVTPPPGITLAKPKAGPNDPYYQGTDPRSIPGAIGGLVLPGSW